MSLNNEDSNGDANGDEEPQEIVPLFTVPTLDTVQLAFMSSMSNNVGLSMLPELANTFPTFLNTLQSNSEFFRQLQQQNEDSSSDLAPPSSNSGSPDLEAQVNQVEPKSKRSRQKRKEFPIETGDITPRKLQRHSSSSSTVNLSKTTENESRALDSTPSSSSEFEKELAHKYETAINALQSLSDDIKRVNFVPLLGQSNNIEKLAENIKKEFNMWKDVIPQAQQCIRRHRMSADDQAVLNTLLVHYKTEHPEDFNSVLTMTSALYDKQERIVQNNFKKAMTKETNAAKFALLFQSDDSDSRRAAEQNGSKLESSSNDESASPQLSTNLKTLFTESLNITNQNGVTAAEKSSTAMLQIQSLNNTVLLPKILDLCVENSATTASLVRIMAKVFEQL